MKHIKLFENDSNKSPLVDEWDFILSKFAKAKRGTLHAIQPDDVFNWLRENYEAPVEKQR